MRLIPTGNIAPLQGADLTFPTYPGLMPWAIIFRPFGALGFLSHPESCTRAVIR